MQALLEYRGSFRYIDPSAVERAIREAGDHLEDDALSELDREWMRYVRRRGTTLHVDAVLPASADRYVAAAVIGALARGAIEGCVDVMSGNDLLDAFTSEA